MNQHFNRRSFILAATSFTASFTIPVLSWAQGAYPDHPIRVLIGTPPGDTADGWTRQLAQGMSAILGQPLIVDNKPGAHGMIVGSAAKVAPKDGYTLLVSTGGPMSINPSVYKDKLTYDPIKDFIPIAPVVKAPLLLYCNVDLPVKNVNEMVAYVKARRGQISYGSGGVGTTQHLSMEMLKKVTGMEMTHVPYRGSPMVIQDVIGGQIPFAFDAGGSLLPQMRSGRVRVIAVTSPQRYPALPDVPTFVEQGLPSINSQVWMGLFAPVGTPSHIVARLDAAVTQAASAPEFARSLANAGAAPWLGSSDDLRRFLAADIARWAVIVKAAGVQPD